MVVTIPVPTFTAMQLVLLAAIAVGSAVAWLILGYVYDKGWRETAEKAPLTGLARFCVFVARVDLFLSVPIVTIGCVLAVFKGWQ